MTEKIELKGTIKQNNVKGKALGYTGPQGEKGENGISPTIEVEEIENGHKLTIIDVNGSQEVDILDGERGEKGESGTNGVDGVSPRATITQNEQGAIIEIVDANGTTRAQIYNGATQDLSNYYTKSEVDSAIDDAISSIVDGDEVSY